MKYIQVAICVVLLAAITAALKCYKCKDVLGGRYYELPEIDCLDKYDSAEQVVCPEKYERCMKSISHTYETQQGKKYISSYIIERSCLNSTTAKSECEEGIMGQGEQSVCYCEGDLCNSSSTTSLSLLAMFFSIVFAAVKFH